MWKHLRERFRQVYVRVLHPHIPTHERVEILRGLPEGSKLSPSLFGIYVADLILELRRRFPNATVAHGSAAPVWIGGILYVDDLALISTDPDELQAMLDVCQNWSERTRVQINAGKSKIMVFHEPSDEHAKRLRRPTSRSGGVKTRLPPTSFHPRHHFPRSLPADQRVTNLEEVKEFTCLGLCLDSSLSMHAALREIKSRASKAHALVSAVSYSLRYDKRRWNTNTADTAIGAAPSRILTLWKSTVLPHYLLYLRYITTRELADSMQVAMTKSLETTLHVYGEKTSILIETGIPPLHLTQHVQLAQFRFRLRTCTGNIIPHQLWSLWEPIANQLPLTSLDRRMHASTKLLDPKLLDPDRLPIDCPAPRSVESAQLPNREKCYRRHLESCATKWWIGILQDTLDAGRAISAHSRQIAYLSLHLGDLRKRRSAYSPAHYLKCAHPAQLDLLLLRAQASPI